MKSLVVHRRVAMLLVSHLLTAASNLLVKAAQAIGAAVDVQFYGQLHPNV